MNKALLRQDKLNVKNKLQTQYLKPVLSDQHPPIPITESREQKDNGNVFKGYYATVTDIHDISQVRTYLVSNKLDVTKASYVDDDDDDDDDGCFTATFVHMVGQMDRAIKHIMLYMHIGWKGQRGTGHELLKMMLEHNMLNTV